jgi:hypothetical protein
MLVSVVLHQRRGTEQVGPDRHRAEEDVAGDLRVLPVEGQMVAELGRVVVPRR